MPRLMQQQLEQGRKGMQEGGGGVAGKKETEGRSKEGAWRKGVTEDEGGRGGRHEGGGRMEEGEGRRGGEGVWGRVGRGCRM